MAAKLITDTGPEIKISGHFNLEFAVAFAV